MSEFERPERAGREPTAEDIQHLVSGSAPHFALHIRNRIHHLIEPLPPEHPVRAVGEREMERMERIAVEGEHRGAAVEDLGEMPSIRRE